VVHDPSLALSERKDLTFLARRARSPEDDIYSLLGGSAAPVQIFLPQFRATTLCVPFHLRRRG
jgi:hypothetical protein